MSLYTPGIISIEQLIERFKSANTVLSDGEMRKLNLPLTKNELEKWIRQLKLQYKHSSQRFTVMLLGEYNAGKSTLLNALLGLPPGKRLPTFDEPTNAIPIRLSHASNGTPEAIWVTSDGREENKPWQEAVSAATQQKKVEGISEVKVFLDHPLLQQADILDMPGTGTAWYDEHTAVTRDYIANSEMIIWVIGADEPSREGLKDYNLVRQANVPITVVFNAWGYLDEERNKELFIDQDAIEESVRLDFREPFEKGNVFRVYARKCIEAQEKGLEVPEEFGLDVLTDFLNNNYLGDFLDVAHDRRRNVQRQVSRIADEAKRQINKGHSAWETELRRQSTLGENVAADLMMMNTMEHQIRGNIRKLARPRAAKILDYIRQQTEFFINDTLVASNFELWKKGFTKKRREELANELTNKLKNEYLDMGKKNNWLENEIVDYLEESWVILEANWRRFLGQIEIEMPQNTFSSGISHLPYDQILQATRDSTKAFVMNLLKEGGKSLGILLFLPASWAASIVVAAITYVFSLGMKSLRKKPLEKQRESTLKRIRLELEMQQTSVSNRLLEIVTEGPHAELQRNFQKDITRRKKDMSGIEDFLKNGIETIDNLCLALADAAEGNITSDKSGV